MGARHLFCEIPRFGPGTGRGMGILPSDGLEPVVAYSQGWRRHRLQDEAAFDEKLRATTQEKPGSDGSVPAEKGAMGER